MTATIAAGVPKPETPLSRDGEIGAQCTWTLHRGVLAAQLEEKIDRVNAGAHEQRRDVCHLAEELGRQRREAGRVALQLLIAHAFSVYSRAGLDFREGWEK